MLTLALPSHHWRHCAQGGEGQTRLWFVHLKMASELTIFHLFKHFLKLTKTKSLSNTFSFASIVQFCQMSTFVIDEDNSFYYSYLFQTVKVVLCYLLYPRMVNMSRSHLHVSQSKIMFFSKDSSSLNIAQNISIHSMCSLLIA